MRVRMGGMDEYAAPVQDALQSVEDYSDIFYYGAIGLGVLLFVLFLLRFFRRLFRKQGGAVQLHPKLQKYAGFTEAEIEAECLEAEKIIATSSTTSVAGYVLIRQIEAVFVEGHRSQKDALQAIKAAAGRCGGNAIINLSQDRTAAGKCSAQGDAVLLKPKGQRKKSDGARW